MIEAPSGSATLNGVDGRADSPAPVPVPPQVRRRADAERNERHIVEAAGAVLWRQPAATIGEIALASGLGRATIYRHFPTRDDLLRGVARHGFEQTVQALRDARPEEGTAVEALVRMIEASIQPGNACMLVLNQVPEPVASNEEKAELHAPIAAALAGGELRADLDIPWTLRTIGALYELAMQELASGNVTREEAVELMASSLLQGALAR